MEKVSRALVSVSNKEGLIEFAHGLTSLGVELVSTGGTARALKAEGLPVQEVSEITGFPEILDGRVKTLHPKIFGGILAAREKEGHRADLAQHGIPPFDLVVVNLYPFVQTVSKPGVTIPEAIEQIDIGGVTLIRAAAKNFAHVTVVTEPGDYARVLAELRTGGGNIPERMRLELAHKAFAHTREYDTAISAYLERQLAGEERDSPPS
jgi:phosphoribosylaminoimidazolecarboxamide formyltransferase/IMP cyclohydrolase